MGTRLIDIARRADVSEATVSRVLNGRPGVNESTRSVVLAAARELGRDLSGSPALREDLVGVLVPDLENPVFALWVERIEAELFERGAGALFAARARTTAREQVVFERFVRAGARAVIVISGHHAQEQGVLDHYRALVEQGISLVLINGEREHLGAAFISSDDAHAVRLAEGHLRELGHTALGLAVGDEHTWPVRHKVRTFEELIAAHGSPARDIAFTDFSYAGGYQAARELVGRGCTGILCGSDVMAAGALEGVRSLGLRVPEDVSIVGYDDAQWAALTNPALTTVRQAVPEMARAAVRAALQSGESSRRPVRSELVMRPQLIVRGSTAAAPARRGGAPGEHGRADAGADVGAAGHGAAPRATRGAGPADRPLDTMAR